MIAEVREFVKGAARGFPRVLGLSAVGLGRGGREISIKTLRGQAGPEAPMGKRTPGLPVGAVTLL